MITSPTPLGTPMLAPRRPLRRSDKFLAAFLVFGLCLLFLWPFTVFVIRPGEVGVLYRLFTDGTVTTFVYEEGLGLKWPWNRIYRYELRTQAQDETVHALASDGLTIDVDITVLFRPIEAEAGVLHKTIGPEYVSRIVRPNSVEAVRSVVGQTPPHDIYRVGVEHLQRRIFEHLKVSMGTDVIQYLDVIIRDLRLPPSLNAAITRKLSEEQIAEAYEYVLQQARQEAERLRIEAIGIQTFLAKTGVRSLGWNHRRTMPEWSARSRRSSRLKVAPASLENRGQAQARSAGIAVATVALADVPESLWQHLVLLLSEDERARAAHFHFERNRREYVAAHALKRLMLCEAAGGAPLDWAFTAEPDGKPLVVGGQGPHFNLSHCDGLVACALSPDFPLGVDVESVERHAPLDIAEHYFAPGERAWLSGLPEAERSRGFFQLWTMKEAVIKATGKGVSQDLQSFVVSFDPLRISFLDPTRAEPGEWRLAQQAIGEGHLLGLAWRGPAAEVMLRAVRLEAHSCER